MKRLALGIAVLATLAASASAGAATFSTRTLSDARVGNSMPELEAQAYHSLDVVEFFTRSHRWMIAPRHATCWSIVGRSYRRTCNRARLQLRAHEWLEALALSRLASLYPEAYAEKVIREVWVEDPEKAISVARCESHFHTWATNGQYRGIFQMGTSERAKYGGSSSDVREQVEAAHRYYLAAGWRPWACA